MGHGLRALLALVALARVQTGAEVLSFNSIGDQDDTFPTYTSQWSNRSDLVAEVDVVTCRRHSDCGQYEFCFGKVGFGNKGLGICQNFFSETCTAEQPCDVGDGDCDTDFDCVSDLVCGTDNCPFIGTNRVPSSADCCIRPPDVGWVFGETQSVAELNLDQVATPLENAISNGTFSVLCQENGFEPFSVLTTFFAESLVNDRFIVDCIIHILSPMTVADFDTVVEPHRTLKYFFASSIAEVVRLSSPAQVSIDAIKNDTSTVSDTGDAESQSYRRRRLGNTNAIKVFLRIDLGTTESYFEEQFKVAPRSARSSVSYLQYLQVAERNTGKACEPGYMGHDCTERTCAYGLSVYSSLFLELDNLHVPGFHTINGPEWTRAQHTYSECSDAGVCNRKTAQCECYKTYWGKACSRVRCPQDCSGHGRCLPSSFVDGRRPSSTDVLPFSSKDWDRFKRHTCHCDRGWEGIACSQKICPRGDYVMTVHPDFDVELSGCDVQEIVFANFSLGDFFALSFENFERDKKTTRPVEFTGNATAMALAIKIALEELPNEVIPEVTTLGVENGTLSDLQVHVVFTDPRNTGLQPLLQCVTTSPGELCLAGMRPMMLPTEGTCSVQHVLSSEVLNENLECGGRGHCDRAKGVCECNVGTYGEACEMTTDYL